MTQQREPQAASIPGDRLRAWREARGWDRGHLASQLRRGANGVPVADYASLVRTIRRWEIGQNEVSERYGLLLRQLGYPEVAVDVSDVRWLAARQRRTDVRLWVAIVSVALDIALSVAVIIFGIQLHHQVATTANLCQSTNISRSQQVQLWDYILGLSAQPQTAAEHAKVAAFRHHLQVLFAPRDCADVNPDQP